MTRDQREAPHFSILRLQTPHLLWIVPSTTLTTTIVAATHTDTLQHTSRYFCSGSDDLVTR
jgi:hypothetical protein